MPKYRVKQNFGRWGRHFKIGEVVDVEKSLAGEVRKALEPFVEPESLCPSEIGQKNEQGREGMNGSPPSRG